MLFLGLYLRIDEIGNPASISPACRQGFIATTIKPAGYSKDGKAQQQRKASPTRFYSELSFAKIE